MISETLRTDAEDRKQAAFYEAARAISEQLDGSAPGDSEDVGFVVQQLSFMALTNGGRLDREQSLTNLGIFTRRLFQQITMLQPPKETRKN